ncbi:MAG TPA: metal ABC transporter ATP-binding protein [Burkholderiales bacterium]|nr:metal ABC transporter ATP-binding protein [Burkholderiales bacterium]
MKDVSVVLGGELIVRGVSFALHRGEITTIVGPNGSGKTTLFRALLGLVPFEGEIRWQAGISVGYVPQRFSIAPSTPITATEFFLLKSKRFWLPERAFLDHLDHELGLVGLRRDVLHRPLGRLSSGELQRLLVAWAMLNHPDVLLFDEPTAAVDIGFTETIYAIMRRLTEERGTAILLISHDLNVVFRYAENVLCVNRQLLCQGPPTEVLTPAELKRLFGEVALYRHGHDDAHR